MRTFKYFLEAVGKCDCWDGYKRKPGTKPCSSGSCIKEERGLWDNIHAKQKRIKNGSGEHMRKPGSKGAPTAKALKDSQTNESAWAKQAATAIAMKKAGKKPKNEELESQFDLIEQMVNGIAEQHNLDPEIVWEKFEEVSDEELLEAAVDAKGYKSSTGGLTQKGRDHYNNTEGGHLKAPVTTKPSKLKAGSKAANRRKSFCARMGGVEGPMKKPNGEPTRKALALRKWNC